jgi:hypothetical protein
VGQKSEKTGEPMTVVEAMTEEYSAKVKSHLSQKDWNDTSKRTLEQMFEVARDVDRLATMQFDPSNPEERTIRESRVCQLTQLGGRLNGYWGTKDGLKEDFAALTREVLSTELKLALPESSPSASSQGK